MPRKNQNQKIKCEARPGPDLALSAPSGASRQGQGRKICRVFFYYETVKDICSELNRLREMYYKVYLEADGRKIYIVAENVRFLTKDEIKSKYAHVGLNKYGLPYFSGKLDYGEWSGLGSLTYGKHWAIDEHGYYWHIDVYEKDWYMTNFRVTKEVRQ